MRTRTTAIFTAAIVISGAAYASSYIVEGNLTDKDNQPNIGVVCKVYNLADSIATSISTASDVDGDFLIPVKEPGEYRLELSGIGVKDTFTDFTVSPGDSIVRLKPIMLQSVAENLQEVVVTARKPIIQSDGATLTYNVDEDPAASTNTTLEMLRKVPMVTVDADENIKIKGQTNFKIHINGKEDPMLSADTKNVLKSMPASTIRKFEVITEPGAKYDAEGVGGILNIVTVSNTALEGYSANIDLNATTRYAGGSIYARTKINKVTASVSGSYFNSSWYKEKMTQLSDFDYTVESPQEMARQVSLSVIPPVKNNNKNFNLNLAWEPDTLNLFTLSAYYGAYDGHYDGDNHTTAFNAAGNQLWSYDRYANSKFSGFWSGATLSYQHNFSPAGHNITLSYQFTGGDNTSRQNNRFANLYGISFHTPADGNYAKNENFTHTAQIDYTLPMRRAGHTLEAGAKANWNPSVSRKETLYGSDIDAMETYLPSVYKLRQINDILAAYVSYSATFGKISGKAGVRYEHTNLGIRYKEGKGENFTTRLNDIVPNAAVSYIFSPASSLRLAYQMRISRPNVGELNPYIDNTTPTILQYGNPDLKSSRFNNISLTYSNYGLKFGGSVAVEYSQNDNSVEQYVFSQNGIVNSTYMNIGHNRRWSFNANGNWSVINNLRLALFGSASHVEYFVNEGTPGTLSNSGLVGNLTFSADYTTPFKLRISAFYGGGTKQIALQGKSGAWDFHGLSLSRSFLKEDRLTISLNAQNIFHPHRTWKNIVSTNDVTFRQSTRMAIWNVGGSIAYRLGSLKANVKSTSNRLEKIEQNTSGSQPGQGL